MSRRRAFAVLVGSALLAAACPGQQPLQHVRDVRQTDGMGLDWVWEVKLRGPHLLVTSHRDGDLHVFRRDTTGGVVRVATADLNGQAAQPTRHMDPYAAVAGGAVFVAGAWTHHHGDGDGIGLFHYGWDEAAGTLRFRDHQRASAAGGLLAAPGGKRLYLAAPYARAVLVYRLDGEQPPQLEQTLAGPGRGARLALAPNGRTLYSCHADGVAAFAVQPEGRLADAGVVAANPPSGEPREQALSVSPDGRHLYATLTIKQRPGTLRTFACTPSGALSLVSAREDPALAGLADIAWLDDGRGLFCGVPDSAAGGLGWFRRDPRDGALAEFARLKHRANPAWRLACDPETGLIYLGGFWSSKQFSVFRWTGE
jgi:6-phosphogluconolactonase (cycloisomerase 2 family)